MTGAATTVVAPGPGWVTVDGNLVDLDAGRDVINPAAMAPRRYVVR